MSLTKLEPCPFCGDGPKLTVGYDGPRVSCENRKCVIAPSTDNYADEVDAVAAWNRRSTSAAERGMREALEKAAGELQKWLPTLSVHRSRQDCDHIRDVIAEARAALSPKGEGK